MYAEVGVFMAPSVAHRGAAARKRLLTARAAAGERAGEKAELATLKRAFGRGLDEDMLRDSLNGFVVFFKTPGGWTDQIPAFSPLLGPSGPGVTARFANLVDEVSNHGAIVVREKEIPPLTKEASTIEGEMRSRVEAYIEGQGLPARELVRWRLLSRENTRWPFPGLKKEPYFPSASEELHCIVTTGSFCHAMRVLGQRAEAEGTALRIITGPLLMMSLFDAKALDRVIKNKDLEQAKLVLRRFESTMEEDLVDFLQWQADGVRGRPPASEGPLASRLVLGAPDDYLVDYLAAAGRWPFEAAESGPWLQARLQGEALAETYNELTALEKGKIRKDVIRNSGSMLEKGGPGPAEALERFKEGSPHASRARFVKVRELARTCRDEARPLIVRRHLHT